jgi:WD40 repeat protein
MRLNGFPGLVAKDRGHGEILYGTGDRSPYPIHRWDASTGAMLPDLGKHRDYIVNVRVLNLPDGREIVLSNGWEDEFHRWDPATGEEVEPPMTGHEMGVFGLDSVPLPDGRLLLVTCDLNGGLRRWDASTGQEIGSAGDDATPCGPSRDIVAVWTEDGPQVFIGETDGICRRDALTGELLETFAEEDEAPALVRIEGAPWVCVEVLSGVVEFRPLLA